MRRCVAVFLVMAWLGLGGPVTSAGAQGLPAVGETHVISASGFVLSHLFVLDKKHRLAGMAQLAVSQAGPVAGTAGPSAGPWFELVVTLGPTGYWYGPLPAGGVQLNTSSGGTIRLQLGGFGPAVLHLVPTPAASSPATLFTNTATYPGPGGVTYQYTANALLESWKFMDVSGRCGQYIVTSRVPKNANVLAGTNQPAAVAVAAEDQTAFSAS